MKITVWIRPDRDDPKGRGITLRADWKPESGDTPPLQHYGLQLFNAIKGTAAPTMDSSNKETK